MCFHFSGDNAQECNCCIDGKYTFEAGRLFSGVAEPFYIHAICGWVPAPLLPRQHLVLPFFIPPVPIQWYLIVSFNLIFCIAGNVELFFSHVCLSSVYPHWWNIPSYRGPFSHWCVCVFTVKFWYKLSCFVNKFEMGFCYLQTHGHSIFVFSDNQ